VTVYFPHQFTIQEEFGGLTRSVSDSGEVVFTSGLIDDSTEMSAWFTAVQPVPASDFRVRNLTIGSLSLSLRYWVDDVGWADQVERVMRAGYAVLRDMIGLGDPIVKKLTVEEASSQEIGGFSGSYDPTAGTVLVSYFADPFVILHEAAHMWFNVDLLSDRWAQEGFASYYAQQAVDRLGYADHAPVLTTRMRQSAVPLNDWIAAGDPNSAVDAYLYGASLEVARQVAEQVGQPAMTAVWLADRSGSAAYRALHGNPAEVPVGEPTDWRRLLDLLEQTSGRSCTEIWRAWIVDPSQAAMLDQRDVARAAYGAADHEAGAWNLPPEIRDSLDAWQFGQAIAYVAQARAILTQRDQIAAEALAEKTTPPTGLQAAFERSGLVAANLEATNELAVLAALSAARQAQTQSNGAAPAVGLLGADPAAELRSAREAFARGDLSQAESLANGARSAWQSANGAGQVRILGSLSVLAGSLLLLVTFVWARGVRAKGGRRRGQLAKAGAGAGSGDVAAAAPVDGFATDSSGAHGADLGVMAMSRDWPAIGDDGSTPYEESAYELLQRGHALLRDHHNAQAAVVLERAARLERSKGSILEALARAYFNCGQPARAAETFEALLEVDPSAPYGHFGLGLSFARLGRPLEARTQLRLAVALDPTSDTYKRALDTLDAQQD
jgi:tetratricopeptide (TPR) repeat protein